MIVYKPLSEGQAANLTRQLYKYYDIDGEVQPGEVQYDNNDHVYRVFFDKERGIGDVFCRFRTYEHCDTIEDLYTVDENGKNEEPTTSKEQMEVR